VLNSDQYKAQKEEYAIMHQVFFQRSKDN